MILKELIITPGYKHITLGGSDTERVDYEIEQDWVKEIWDKVNPGLKLSFCNIFYPYYKRNKDKYTTF